MVEIKFSKIAVNDHGIVATFDKSPSKVWHWVPGSHRRANQTDATRTLRFPGQYDIYELAERLEALPRKDEALAPLKQSLHEIMPRFTKRAFLILRAQIAKNRFGMQRTAYPVLGDSVAYDHDARAFVPIDRRVVADLEWLAEPGYTPIDWGSGEFDTLCMDIGARQWSPFESPTESTRHFVAFTCHGGASPHTLLRVITKSARMSRTDATLRACKNALHILGSEHLQGQPSTVIMTVHDRVAFLALTGQGHPGSRWRRSRVNETMRQVRARGVAFEVHYNDPRTSQELIEANLKASEELREAAGEVVVPMPPFSEDIVFRRTVEELLRV